MTLPIWKRHFYRLIAREVSSLTRYYDRTIELGSIEEMPDLTLLMGSNDEGKAYLNGKEAVKFDGSRSFEKDTDKAEGLTLKKGINTIVFKVINESNNWQGSIRFTTKDGAAIKDFKVQLTPG